MRPQSRRWLVALFFLGWSVLAALCIGWLIGNAADLGNAVIRVGPEEAKAWSVRVRETVALARLNFPWALAWFFLTPYVLWVGVRYSFEAARWRTRLPVLLATGMAFVCASQWLAQRLVAGQRMIVMVRYSADTAVENFPIAHELAFDQPPRVVVTNRFITNHMTKVMISDEATRASDRAELEIAAAGMLSVLGTNLPVRIGHPPLENLPISGPSRPSRWSAVLDGLAFVALIGMAHAGVFHRRYKEREQQATLLESRLNQARLRALQAKLQPHFLFNTLNGIATLLRRDPATAGDMLQSLSELLRIALNSSNRQEIPLREELDFLGRYLAIQRMRFGDRLQVSEEIEATAMDCLVPALLLQPLVENAICHGFEPSGQPGKLRIAAARDGEWLRLTVEDDGVGLAMANRNRQGSGVGLANVRERLTTLHGHAQEFSIAERAEGGVAVNIRLPARTEVVAANRQEVTVT